MKDLPIDNEMRAAAKAAADEWNAVAEKMKLHYGAVRNRANWIDCEVRRKGDNYVLTTADKVRKVFDDLGSLSDWIDAALVASGFWEKNGAKESQH